MVMSSTCPQCGTPDQSGATCTACGHPRDHADEAAVASGAAPPEPGRATPTARAPAAPATGSFDAARILEETRERWGVQQSPLLVGAMVLPAIAVLVSTFAHISYLTAGANEQLQLLHAQVWFTFALGAAVATAALLVLIRWQSGQIHASSESGVDLRVGLGLVGLVLIFLLAGLFKGLDESLDAADSWFRYAGVFTFLAIGWLAISRPVPATLSAIRAQHVGLVAIGVGAVMLVIGLAQGMSEDLSSYSSGVSFQQAGGTIMLLSFGWFLGLQPRAD